MLQRRSPIVCPKWIGLDVGYVDRLFAVSGRAARACCGTDFLTLYCRNEGFRKPRCCANAKALTFGIKEHYRGYIPALAIPLYGLVNFPKV